METIKDLITKEVKIVIPDGMEIDKENSTFECIKFKPIDKQVKTWDDLKYIRPKGYFITSDSDIIRHYISCDSDKNIAATEKHCKSMLAMARISQLMPYYGGAITDEEWSDSCIFKYIIVRLKNEISTERTTFRNFFLAFHTAEQRDEFLNNNEQLVKDYLML